MKKEYKNPHFQLVYVDTNDLVCSSPGSVFDGNTIENGDGSIGAAARSRNNPIWDDYEN